MISRFLGHMCLAVAFAIGFPDHSWCVEGSASDQVREPSSQVAIRVAELFQANDTPVDLDGLKEILELVVNSHAIDKPHDGQGDEFYGNLEKLLAYCDAHAIRPSDIQAIREWEARTMDCGRDGQSDELPLAERLSLVFRCVWQLADEKNARCEPRHAILCSTLSATLPTNQFLARFATKVTKPFSDAPGWAGKRQPAVVDTFLLKGGNKALRTAIVKEAEEVFRASVIPEAKQFTTHIQGCLDSKGDSQKFAEHVAGLITTSEKALKAIPRYALADLNSMIAELRIAWNVVHAFGDAKTKALLEKYVESLRQHFAGQSDGVVAEWLSQVMSEPGPPPENILVDITISRPEDLQKQGGK